MSVREVARVCSLVGWLVLPFPSPLHPPSSRSMAGCGVIVITPLAVSAKHPDTPGADPEAESSSLTSRGSYKGLKETRSSSSADRGQTLLAL